MEDINKRLIDLRKVCKKSQSEFSRVLGLSRSGVADIETGRRAVNEKHLIMLSNWEEYNVNIDWLRTGEGEMFLPDEPDALETVRRKYHLTDRQFRFFSNFLRLPENEKDVIFNFLQSVFDDGEPVEERIEKEVNSYRKDLEWEARKVEKSSLSGTTDDISGKRA